MNLPLINDALAMLRLQFQPLSHYQYPARHLAAALLLLGVVAAAGAPAGMGEPLNVILFFTAYVTLETLLYGRFMQWWLHRASVADVPSLTGTIVAASAIQLLDPLSSWLPDDVASVASMTIGMIGLWLLVSALSFGSGLTKLRILLGTLLFAPVALFLSFVLMNGATGLGLVTMPEELQRALQQAERQADAKPATGSTQAR
ncbi:hypothetical protein ACFSQE_15770 [Vogesella fluminis]|uniref:Yip1 domain-containing protein n=1 Tax=Vogesella fluminis TaxID=1069161 RepID=A0ABQ3HAA1_9NEIS|nr:hypothetical protein [Vogesella fluminis]GHD72843.1 hypothetical protein GCM10011419_06720 [Vogesella fluminis]